VNYASTAEHPPRSPFEADLVLDAGRWGMVAFLVSEAALFSTLIVVYLTFLGRDEVGPSPREALSLPLVIVTTICLLSSSATIYRAEERLAAGDLGGFRNWWSATIGLGFVFLAGTGYEWFELITRHGLTIAHNLFGSTFYTLVGFHGMHVSAGLVAMLLVLLIRPGPAHRAVGMVSWYWHFVDAVWVAVFSVVYLYGR
jgi:cytochrome c oxidase subunit 3/cytochrome o ubiquinol oxidase subunit 3